MNKIFLIIALGIVIFFGILGMKRGVVKEGVTILGLIAIFILTKHFYKPVAFLLMKNLPFFKFDGFTSLNLLVFTALGMLLVFSILLIMLNVLLYLTNFVEKFFNLTIVLGAISKSLGLILGLIKGLALAYIFLNFVSILNLKTAKSEKEVFGKINKKVFEIKEELPDSKNKNLFNKEVEDLLVKNKLIELESIETLKKLGKYD